MYKEKRPLFPFIIRGEEKNIQDMLNLDFLQIILLTNLNSMITITLLVYGCTKSFFKDITETPPPPLK